MAHRKRWMAELWARGIKSYRGEMRICLKFTVRDPERENGRIVEVDMTPEDARSLAESLNQYANRIDEQIEKDARRITNLHLDSYQPNR